MKKFMLTIALTTAAPAQAINLGNFGNVGQIGDFAQFLQQLQEWGTSLTDLDALKDSLLGNVDYEELGAQLGGQLVDYGLNAAGINLQQYMGNLSNFQAEVNRFKSELLARAKGTINLAFTDPAEASYGMEGSLVLNPNMAQNRFKAAHTIAVATKEASSNVQQLTDSAKLVEDVQATVDETTKRARQSTANAERLTTDAANIQSTREGIQMLVRAQAEAITSSTYNATAITTAISQSVRQQQVTNQQLNALVQSELDSRTASARAALEEIRARQAEAAAAGDQVQGVIDTAAEGMTSAFEVDSGGIDVNRMF